MLVHCCSAGHRGGVDWKDVTCRQVETSDERGIGASYGRRFVTVNRCSRYDAAGAASSITFLARNVDQMGSGCQVRSLRWNATRTSSGVHVGLSSVTNTS